MRLFLLSFLILAACSFNANHQSVGEKYLGISYCLDPLGEEKLPDIDPLIRFDAFDCVTFVETVLADGNEDKLTKIRYKNAQVSFFNRNHFIESDWLKNNADSQMRKQITLLKRSGLLDIIDASKRGFKTWAKRANIPKSVYQTGHIVLPCNKKECKVVLAFLNEDLFEGVFSQKIYQSNSKKIR